MFIPSKNNLVVMGQINTVIDDGIEREFRKKIADLGGKKGSLKTCLEEAIKLWLNTKNSVKGDVKPQG